MKKKILTVATTVVIVALNVGTANAADVSSWAEINTNKTEASINFLNDIMAEGTPKVISLNLSNEQTIDGKGYAVTGADGYSFSLNNTADVTFKNLGKYSDGNSEAATFSYTDLNNATKYVNIEKSVNSFPKYVFTMYKNDVALNIENSVFTNNGSRVIGLSGSNETLNIKNSVFYNNSSTVNGAMINVKGIINVENSIFQDNHNLNDDGGIFDISKSTSVVTIKNSYFTNNSSVKFGGVINQIAGILIIEDSKFEGNSSNKDGGAICLDGNINSAEIKNSQFINNHNGGAYYDGGAVSSAGGYIGTVDNVLFEGNNAISKGGGLYGGMTKKHKDRPPILIKDVIFKNNEASTGGGFYTDASSSGRRQNYTYIIDSKFTNNIVKATGHYMDFDIPIGGGMTSATGVPIVINNTTFTGNTADPEGDYAAGGGIYFAGGTAEYPLKIVDSTFTNNSALEGGAIYVDNADTSIIAQTKDVIFSGNSSGADTEDYNGGADIYFDASSYSATLSLNAADEKKIAFNGSIASYIDDDKTSIININNSGVTYNTYDGTTEKPVSAGTFGEVQFNARVGDATQYFSAINLYGGKLSIGQNSANNVNTGNPDGYINDNNFYVKGDSILNTVNNVVGEFAPKVFDIDSGVTLDYQFDVDLINAKSDTISVTNNNGSLRLSSFNVISDVDTEGLKIKYSDTNVDGTVKDGYTITTSKQTYDVTAENSNDGSFIVFSATETGGGLANAIANESNQYIITNNKDEVVTAWVGNNQNAITSDIDIKANNNSIYTENGLDGMAVQSGVNAVLRNIKELSGFNNALTNDGGNLTIVDSNITGNTGTADITNNSGSIIIDAATRDITIGSNNTENALISDSGLIEIKGTNKVTFNGNVSGTQGAKMNISTDTAFNGNITDMNITQSKGTVNLNNVSEAVYSLNDGTLNLGENGKFAPDIFELNNGTVNIANETSLMSKANIFSGGNLNAVNNNVGNLNFNNLTLNNRLNLAVDIDLKNQVMDTISAYSVKGNGIIKVNNFNVLSDTNKSKFSIYFADDNIKDRVSTDIKTIEGEIFKYNIAYDPKTGYFNIIGGGGNSEGYSPSVMASPIAAQLQGYLTQLNSYDEAFRNMDMYMLMPKSVRQAMKYKNRIAISSSDSLSYNTDETMNENNKGWVRTHTTFEKVPLKHGPKVGNIAYGTFFGSESEMYDLGHGWEGTWGLYAGYNGSHQSYKGISMYQNGGTLGLIGMAYKGNFFQGLTINSGANGGEANTNYGNEDFAMLMAGIASKTGYNIEFKEGKLIVQPNLLLSYSFVNTFDYTNAAGVKISSDPLHALQVEPNIKFIANLQNGWQPYASVGMNWSIMDKTHYKANNVSLPNLSVKPYVKYGVGIRKSWGEKFTGFFQTYITNGGRNGVGIQLGFRWAFGNKKSDSNVLNKSTTTANKKIIKNNKALSYKKIGKNAYPPHI